MSIPQDILIRPASPEDDPAITALLCETLGWVDDDRHRALFRWKHRENHFGSSPGWVALDEHGLVGSRIFMPWRFRIGDETVTAVRAVDTATHPRAQGRGIFRALTMRGVDEMTGAGVGWVFNTPNDQSAPGYLSMGWRRLGRLPMSVRPAGPQVFVRLLRSRVPGELWSTPCSAGEDAGSVLGETELISELLSAQPTIERVHTDRSLPYLRWRYGSGPIGYRAWLFGPSLRDGVGFFRLRRRGAAVEAVLAETIAPGGNRRVGGRLVSLLLAATGADYVVALGSPRPRGWLPALGNGPLLTCRELARKDPPPIGQWDLAAGDVELF